MKKDKITRWVLGIAAFIICIIYIIALQGDYFLKKGKVEAIYNNLDLMLTLDCKDTNLYKIGLGKKPEEYYLRFYKKDGHAPLSLLSEERILLPSKKMLVGLKVKGPSVTVKIFDENMKIIDKTYTSTKWRDDYQYLLMEEYEKEGWKWQDNLVDPVQYGKIIPLYQGIKIRIKEVTKDYFSTEGYTLFDGDMEDFNSKDVEGNFLFLEAVN
ncbi:MAG: hypothetical protein Q4Q07_01520 [Tissierellia bacterium]|nr:hypothetical protein [Tissierellia bacterium]